MATGTKKEPAKEAPKKAEPKKSTGSGTKKKEM